MKKFLSATNRITLSLVSMALTTLLGAHLLGLVPSERDAIMRGRSHMCESIAIQFSVLAHRGDQEAMETSLKALVERNRDIRSVGLRQADGTLVVATDTHAQTWPATTTGQSTETHMFVPIFQGDKRWGTVEVCYTPPSFTGWAGKFLHPLLALCLYFVSVTLIVFGGYLKKVLTQLNPSKVVPQRVRSALDSLSEGLLLLDPHGRIVLANQSFSDTTGCELDDLLGRPAAGLKWLDKEDQGQPSDTGLASAMPWVEVLKDGQPRRGRILAYHTKSQGDKTFTVSASPICDDSGRRRGAIASFEDVTRLERKKDELSTALQTLRHSTDKIREQNAALERLATRDPLTDCFNRRSFFEQFDAHWNAAQRYNHPLSAIMVDIDHFKSVNDNHGHSVGDQVLQKVAETLKATARDADVVARYGGEEFAVLLPHTDILDGAVCAERFRKALAAMKFPHLSVTASLGVSAISLHPASPQELLDQADKSLYVAKRNGRNQVVRFDQVPTNLVVDEKKVTRTNTPTPSKTHIPFPAVTALISALGYRDPDTASHSRRVADLCVDVAQGLMSMSNCYVLETAALLHDIGKIGMPDSILRKPGKLSEDEWALMHKHERIGLEIIRASFASDELSQIVENYRRHFDGRNENLGPTGTHIPLGARILAVADAFDSMVTERSYRPARSHQEAFAELRRCAGTQFDTEIVERFIKVSQRYKPEPRIAGQVSKETALGIGLEMERLSEAVDQQDIAGLKVMAGRLSESAARSGAPEIAAKALELEQAASAKGDVLGVIQRACELLDYCRATQSSYLEHSLPQPATALVSSSK
jgi:diguanylate cyclase (GGDEF)-like protein/putative nucleotidyltransferase with HDIG domain/PAS domain S-box-containing protein